MTCYVIRSLRGRQKPDFLHVHNANKNNSSRSSHAPLLDVRSRLSLWEEMRQNNYSLLDVRLSELRLTVQNLKVSLPCQHEEPKDVYKMSENCEKCLSVFPEAQRRRPQKYSVTVAAEETKQEILPSNKPGSKMLTLLSSKKVNQMMNQ